MQNHNHIVVNMDVLITVWSVFFSFSHSFLHSFIHIYNSSSPLISNTTQSLSFNIMLELELFREYLHIKMISFVAVAHAFNCITTDTYLGYNSTTKLLAHILRLFDRFLVWLQINPLNWFQLFFIANKLILYLIIQLYLLILYLVILNCNTINSYGDIGEALQKQVVRIGSDDCRYVNTTYPKKLIYNLHGYSSDTNIVHASKNVVFVQNRDKKIMEENNMDVNSQLHGILFEFYVIFLQVLIYENLLPSYVAKDAWFNIGSIGNKEKY